MKKITTAMVMVFLLASIANAVTPPVTAPACNRIVDFSQPNANGDGNYYQSRTTNPTARDVFAYEHRRSYWVYDAGRDNMINSIDDRGDFQLFPQTDPYLGYLAVDGNSLLTWVSLTVQPTTMPGGRPPIFPNTIYGVLKIYQNGPDRLFGTFDDRGPFEIDRSDIGTYYISSDIESNEIVYLKTPMSQALNPAVVPEIWRYNLGPDGVFNDRGGDDINQPVDQTLGVVRDNVFTNGNSVVGWVDYLPSSNWITQIQIRDFGQDNMVGGGDDSSQTISNPAYDYTFPKMSGRYIVYLKKLRGVIHPQVNLQLELYDIGPDMRVNTADDVSYPISPVENQYNYFIAGVDVTQRGIAIALVGDLWNPASRGLPQYNFIYMNSGPDFQFGGNDDKILTIAPGVLQQSGPASGSFSGDTLAWYNSGTSINRPAQAHSYKVC